MGCGCGDNAKKKLQATYVISLPNGEKKEVQGEAAARIEITKAGGGTYRMK